MWVVVDVEVVADVVGVVALVVAPHHHQGLAAAAVVDQNGERDAQLDATPSATFKTFCIPFFLFRAILILIFTTSSHPSSLFHFSHYCHY
jgi:hypothetical protein